MSTQFIPLLSLLAAKSKEDQIFLSEVVSRDLNPDGTDKSIIRRMDNDICRKCHLEYRKKFPNQKFQIKCRGIYDEDFFQTKHQQLLALGEKKSLDEVREIYDPAFWGERHMVVKNTAQDYVPFIPRWYQRESLICTAPRKVDRWGRGMGKSQAGVCEELHLSLTWKNLETAIIAPQQTMAEMWYLEILNQVENSPSLYNVIAGQKQSPYYLIRFNNGSIIKIFTAGSGSGKKGGSIRGQNPRRIRADEQDYLAEGDYDAIWPLMRRFKELTFHGSSTPTGLRSSYYRMCKELPDYKEFYHPITDHPEWSDQKKEECMRECKTTDRYLHEYMAEFGSPTAGVFKSVFIDRAITNDRHKSARYNPACNYVMGIDWNGEGTGTRIYVIEYNPETRRRRPVERSVIDEPDATTVKSIAELKRLNRKWMCDHIYVDAGFGDGKDELIRLEGKLAGKGDPQTYKLKNLHKIDFGGTLEFNKLVPNREPGEKKRKNDDKENTETRRTKPFMVEGSVMALEQELLDLSIDDDALLIEQMRGYRVKTWSAHGFPASYQTDTESGDHDLDAFMLAMLGIEVNYGLYHTIDATKRLAHIVHVASWGSTGGVSPLAPAAVRNALAQQDDNTSPAEKTESNRAALRNKAGISSRLAQMMKTGPKVVYSNRSGAFIVPGQGGPQLTSRVPSRAIGSGAMSRPGNGASPFNTIGQGLIFNKR